jgi:hypothetical protein
MNKLWRNLFRSSERTNWEHVGYQTMISCHEQADAIETCALHLQSYEDGLQPESSTLDSAIKILRNRAGALQDHLYDRPVPVNDASMLTHRLRVRTVLILSLLTAGTCLAGNLTTFVLLGWAPFAAFFAALFMTALPLGLGHLAYERLVANNKMLQVIVILVIAGLGLAAVYELGQARRAVIDKASAAQSGPSSYVDGGTANDPQDAGTSPDGSEVKVKGTLGGASFLITIAAELGLGFLVGLFVKLRTDEDYAAWKELKNTLEKIVGLEAKIAELFSCIKRAKKQCMAGIRRAMNMRKKRTPYHKALVAFVVFLLFCTRTLHAQTVAHEEGALIDESMSISKGGTRDLFQEYLRTVRKLLGTEPPNSRVWVSSIASDSFGGVHEILKGRTPESHGIFTDDLDRARHELAVAFEGKSSGIAPTAQGTDIIGALWHFKALFESLPSSSSRGEPPTRTLWILSDMMNETREFPMPELLDIGPERMFERARANGLLVPLPRYKVHVYGASTAGLTPRSWGTIRKFWEIYFAAAGAELVTYSAECDVHRSTE